jgi:hypothetical protein
MLTVKPRPIRHLELKFFTVNAILRDCIYRKKALIRHGKLDELYGTRNEICFHVVFFARGEVSKDVVQK